MDTLPDKTWDREAWKAQKRLKELLRDGLGDANVWSCEANWNGVTGALDLSGVLAELPAGVEH